MNVLEAEVLDVLECDTIRRDRRIKLSTSCQNIFQRLTLVGTFPQFLDLITKTIFDFKQADLQHYS